MLPNFIVAGVQKGGTTSLFNYLRDHPDIFLPEIKETKFFALDERYQKGIEHYQSFFQSHDGEAAVGEIDPDYLYFEPSIERMDKHLDLRNMKFIFLLRDPVARAFSHYLMSYRRGIEPLTFEEAIREEGKRVKNDILSKLHYSYISRGYYYTQLMHFLKYVNKLQTLYLLTEDLIANPKETLKKLFTYLNINPDYIPEDIGKLYHTATIPKNMWLLQRIEFKDGIEKKLIRLIIPFQKQRLKLRQMILDFNQKRNHEIVLEDKTREYLYALYKEENCKLAELTNCDLSVWSD
jgi:hypothetical protein